MFYLFSRKIKDPYNIFGESNSVIGAAVDVMSFTHDIVLCTTSPEQSHGDSSAAMKKDAKNLQTKLLNPTKTDSITQPKKSKSELNALITEQQSTKSSVNDPLRELVIISETVEETDKNYVSNIKELATQAIILVDDKPKPMTTTATKTLATAATTVKNLVSVPIQGTEITNITSIFQDPKDIIDPEKERAFLKQLEELDDTEDSDGFIERPVLGKISLIRRAKSAVAKTSLKTNNIKKDERFPLLTFAWEDQVRQKLLN